MTEGQDERRDRRRLWPLIGLGGTLAVVSVSVEAAGLGAPGFGSLQISLLSFGVLVALVGLWPRVLCAFVRSCYVRRTATGIRTVWSIIGATLIAVCLCEGVLRLLFWAEHKRIREAFAPWRKPTIPDAYKDARWYSEYFREGMRRRHRWDSYSCWLGEPFRGVHINIDEEGLRRTWQRTDAVDGQTGAKPRVFVFGGSTVWGIGARDDHTIPSCMVRRLSDLGLDVEVKNFGQSAHVSTQEVITLLRELQKGNTPDIAVFYDGVNDVHSAYLNRGAGVPLDHRARAEELRRPKAPRRQWQACLNWFQYRFWGFGIASPALRRKLWPVQPTRASTRGSTASPSEALEQEVAQIYETNVRIVDTLARTFGFRALFYWQPAIFTKKVLTPYEAKEAAKCDYAKAFYLGVNKRVRAADRLRREHAFRDLSTVFDAAKDPYYIDFCHITEKGNDIIAREIAKDVAEMLKADRGEKH